MKRKLPPDGSPELAELVRRWRGARNAEEDMAIADEYGFTSTHGLLCSLTAKGIKKGGVGRLLPESTKRRYDKPPQMLADVLIFCDAQIPFHDARFMNACIGLARAWGIKRCLGAGDMVDMTAISQFFHDPEDTLKKEKHMASEIFTILAETFEDVLLLMGNHERRFLHMLKEQAEAQDLLDFIAPSGKIRISDYTYCHVEGKWKVGHPRNTSVIPVRVPMLLGDIDPAWNIASGHGHLCGMTYTKDGSRWAVDIGVCCDPKRLDWIGKYWTTRPAMTQGALILKKSNGKIYPYQLTPVSDFKALTKAYKDEGLQAQFPIGLAPT